MEQEAGRGLPSEESSGSVQWPLGPACAGCRQAHTSCDRSLPPPNKFFMTKANNSTLVWRGTGRNQPCGRCVQQGLADSCRPPPARKRGRPSNRIALRLSTRARQQWWSQATTIHSFHTSHPQCIRKRSARTRPPPLLASSSALTPPLRLTSDHESRRFARSPAPPTLHAARAQLPPLHR